MFGEGTTVFSLPAGVGARNNTQFVRRQAEQEGRELRRLGIDVSFAPVLDVLTDAYSQHRHPLVWQRSGPRGSDGRRPHLCAAGGRRFGMCETFSRTWARDDGSAPSSANDCHDLERLEKIHGIPFYRAMRTAVHSIMTSHPLYPGLDDTPRTPATFSRIVYENLRQRIGYKGVIFSDDLEIGAITDLCPMGEAAVKTAAAGHDALLICHSMKAQKDAFTALVEAYKANRLPMKEMEDSVQRLTILKGKRTERFAAAPATAVRAEKEAADAQDLVRQIVDLSATVLKQGPALERSASTAVIFPSSRSMASTIFIEKAQQSESAFIEQGLMAGLSSLRTQMVGIDASVSDIEAAIAAAAQAETDDLFVYDAHIHAGTKTLLEKVQGSAKRLVVGFCGCLRCRLGPGQPALRDELRLSHL